MQLNQTHERTPTSGISYAITNLCLKSWRKVLSQITKVKGALFDEWRDRLERHERMLRLALNEAEALAWETSYPHLLFPALADEKANGVVEWVRHQMSVRSPGEAVLWLCSNNASFVTGHTVADGGWTAK